jgi:hypothetical protein
MPSIEARNEVVRLTARGPGRAPYGDGSSWIDQFAKALIPAARSVAVVLDRFSLLMHSALRLKRAGLLGHSKGLFYQIGCNRKSVSLGDRFLEFARIFTIDGIVQYLTQKR